MGISVADREKSVLGDSKIIERSEKSGFFLDGQDISIFESWFNCYNMFTKM